MQKKQLNLFAPISRTGYGVHSINFLAAIDSYYDVSLYPIAQPDYDGKYNTIIQKAIARADNLNAKAPSIKIWHDTDMATFCGNPRIAYTVFELDRISPRGKNHLASCNKIIVPSEWAKSILERHLFMGDAIYVVPEGVDTQMFPYETIEYDEKFSKNSPLVVCNVGKFEKRKGHYSILEALRNTTMYITMYAHWFNPFMKKEVIVKAIEENGWTNVHTPIDVYGCRFELYSNPNATVKLYLSLDHIHKQREISNLYRTADVGLFPHFAEGWNLPLSEAMATGLPCITQNYSGPSEYLTPTNHISLAGNMKAAYDGIWFHKQGNWSEVSPEEIANKLWIAYNNPAILADINKELKDFGTKWEWTEAGKKFVQLEIV